MSKKKKKKDSEAQSARHSSLRLNFEAVCQAVILALFCRSFVAEAYKIPTASMEPTLLIGDHLVVNKMLYTPATGLIDNIVAPSRKVRRGDIIVFRSPAEPEQNVVKRVVGLPGESIHIEKKRVYINGERLDEPYAYFSKPVQEDSQSPFFDSRGDNLPATVVPEHHYFVMGDNRDNSYDSRFWGTLPGDLIRGRALMVYWSYDATTEEYLETEFAQRIKNLASTVVYFFSRTRWERTFQLAR